MANIIGSAGVAQNQQQQPPQVFIQVPQGENANHHNVEVADLEEGIGNEEITLNSTCLNTTAGLGCAVGGTLFLAIMRYV